jgi:hypothetical protein
MKIKLSELKKLIKEEVLKENYDLDNFKHKISQISKFAKEIEDKINNDKNFKPSNQRIMLASNILDGIKKLKADVIIESKIILESSDFSLHDICTELQSFVSFDKKDLDAAKKSKITTKNNSSLKRLVSAWEYGRYDEDIDSLKSELINLANKK